MTRFSWLAALGGVLVVASVFPLLSQTNPSSPPADQPASTPLRPNAPRQPEIIAEEQKTLGAVLLDWPERARALARAMIDKYGPPDRALPMELAWDNPGRPWRQIVVHRDATPHDFPVPHSDLLEQAIAYRVPTEKVEAVATFNGSVLIDRTRGEVRVRCGDEAMNMIVLNLVDDLVKGRRKPADARAFMARAMSLAASGKSSPYALSLRFPQTPHTADPDRAPRLQGHPVEP